jgi:2-polyprenyl-6-methoxyphenol hydroxylase-like FAD-dependent oxidoreductase
MSKKALISGASIAGCATAWWLQRYGFDVVLIEKAPEFRTGGQNIDIRDAGREVLRRMGLEEAALRDGTGEEGTAWIGEDGKIVAEFGQTENGSDGPTAEMEILRGDLAQLLFEQIRDKVETRFGTTIAAIDQTEEAVTIAFDGGASEQFDLVIVAEGVGSPTRDLVFPGENEPRWLDMTIAYFTIPRTADDDRLWRWYHTTGGRGVSLRPDQHGTTRAMLSVQKSSDGEENWSNEQQKQWLREEFADAGWEAPRVVAEMDRTDDFYFDVLRQVQMPRWSDGRVALTGDAAWCVTPMGGVGATLAVVGAYILAGELAQQADHRVALQSYEGHLREFVEKAQDIPKIAPRMANPHSHLGLAILHGTLRLVSAPGIRDLFGKLLGGKSKDIDLPEYHLPANDAQ